jgi:hypothetical protein
LQGLVVNHHDRLIAYETTVTIYGMRIDSAKLRVFLRPCDEEGKELGNVIEPGKVQVGAIHNIKSTWFESKDIQNIYIMDIPGSHLDKRGNVPTDVHKGMHLDSSFMFAESGPRKKRKAKIDGC